MKFYKGDLVEVNEKRLFVHTVWQDFGIAVDEHDALVQYAPDKVKFIGAGMERMEEMLGDINVRHDLNGWRCWQVDQLGLAHHDGSGKTRREAVRECYQKWQASNVEKFGKRIGED